MIRVEIAGQIIQINMSIKLLHENMYNFLYKGTKETDVYWEIRYDDKYQIDEMPIVTTKSLKIYDKNDIVVYQYKNEPNIPFMIVAEENYSKCRFYVPRKYEQIDKFNKHAENLLKTCLFNSFREMIILRCACVGVLPLHSAVVSCEEKAYVFAAPSGVGKSTHVKMWENEFDCEIINGDMALVELNESGKCIVYGCPWCGTSGIYTNKSLELGAIAFIQQNDDNAVYELDKEDVGIRLLENHFIPFINKDIATNTVSMINKLAPKVRGFLLECNKKKEAALIAKKYMVKA